MKLPNVIWKKFAAKWTGLTENVFELKVRLLRLTSCKPPVVVQQNMKKRPVQGRPRKMPIHHVLDKINNIEACLSK